jgi:hypothetical protein
MNETTAVVSWLSRKGGVVVSLHRAGRGWTQPVSAASGRRHRDELQVAMDSRGDITLVWRDSVTVRGFGYYVVGGVRRLADQRWARPVRLSGPVRGNYEYQPQVTMDDSGIATVVWLRESSNSDACPVMITHRSRVAVRWSPADRLAVTQGCGRPRLVTNARGDSAAQWTGSPFEGVRPYPLIGVRPADGVWHIHRVRPRSSDGDAGLAVDRMGNVVSAWAERNSSTMWTARRPHDGSWKSPVALSAPGQGWLVGSPEIAIGAERTSTVVWSRLIDGVYDLQGAQRPPGGTWGDVEPVSQGLRASWRGAFGMAMDAQGNTVVAWTHFEQHASRVMVTTR